MKSICRLVCAVSVAILLSGCGGGSSPSPQSITGSSTGILTDGPVQGVSYSTSSGVSGVTSAHGEYNFNPGDTVEFTLGGLTLGNVTATGIISPIQLSGGDSTKLSNLLILFQSLDTDGDPSNGITIAATTAAAVSTAINLSLATDDFASSANTGLVSAMTAGGITRSVTSLASATTHFQAQGFTLLSSNVIVFYDTDFAGMIRILPDGSYLHGQATRDDYTAWDGEISPNLIGTAGSERGTVTVTGFSTTGFQITATVAIDNNLQAGLSHPVECDSQGFLPNGEGFLINVAGLCTGEPVGERLDKAPNDDASLVGVWALGNANSANVQHFVFLPNGKYLMVDPLGDIDPSDDGYISCGGPGVEFGSYVWDSTSGQITISDVTYDTNSCAGFFDLRDGTRRLDADGSPINSGVEFPAFNGTITLNSGGQTAVVIDSEIPAPGLTLYRVSK